jgi:hypothetical protein
VIGPTLLRPAGALPILLATLIASASTGSEARAQEVKRCEAVHQLLTEDMGMVAESSPDTVRYWQTDQILPGCRVTAAGSATTTRAGDEGEALYARLLTVGWKRTPDPRDATNGPALRFRMDETDCFFSIYSGMMVGTQAEMRVNVAFENRPGEDRYNVLVQCVSAVEAAP